MSLLEKEYSIYAIFFVFSIVSWLSMLQIKKLLVQMEKPISLVLLMSFVNFIIIFGIVFSGILTTQNEIWRDITSIETFDIALLVLTAIFSSVGRILFSTLLKYHDPRTMKISGYMMSTLVSGTALYLMRRETFTASRYIGFTMMAFGGYLFIV